MNYYPPVGFRFSVKIEGIPEVAEDVCFQSVSGLSVDIETEEYAEGGENRFKHKLPVRTKFPNLVLKRGFLSNSAIIAWCQDAIENFVFTPKDLIVTLYSNEPTLANNKKAKALNKPLMTWKVTGAIPVKWSVDEFNAEESKLVMETLELTYQFYKTQVDGY